MDVRVNHPTKFLAASFDLFQKYILGLGLVINITVKSIIVFEFCGCSDCIHKKPKGTHLLIENNSLLSYQSASR